MYVWFDALLNYVTALTFAREGEDLTERFWPADLQVMAKDILKFHAVIWPALLMAAGLEPPRRMVIHGYLLMGEKKMSKSLGNVLDPFEVIERFGADALRFYSSARSASVRTARSPPPASRRAMRPSSPTTTATSPVGCWRWSPATATAPSRGGAVDAVFAEDFEGALDRLCGLLDRAELSQALEEALGAGAAPQPLRRGDRAVGARQARRPTPRASMRSSTTWSRACASTTLLLVPYLPQAAEALLGVLGEELAISGRARLASRGPGDRADRTACSRRSRSPDDRLPHPSFSLRSARGGADLGGRRAGVVRI